MREETSEEFEYSQVEKIESLRGSSEKRQETERIREEVKPLVLSQPITKTIDIETTRHCQAPIYDYERPKIGIQPNDLIKNRTLAQIKMFHAPLIQSADESYESTSAVSRQFQPDVHQARELLLRDECTQKVGIDSAQKLNMASINENIELNESVKETRESLKNKIESAQENVNTNLNSFAFVKRPNVKPTTEFGLAREVIELSTHSVCQELKPDLTEIQIAKVSLPEPSVIEHVKVNRINAQNNGVFNELQLEQCDKLKFDVPEITRPIENREPNNFISIVKSPNPLILSTASQILEEEFHEETKEFSRPLKSSYIENPIISRERLELNNLSQTERIKAFNLPIVNKIKEADQEKCQVLMKIDLAETVRVDKEKKVADMVNVQSPVRCLNKEVMVSEEVVEESLSRFEEVVLDERVEVKKESSGLETRLPDKKLLLWLNYPQISSHTTNFTDQTKNLDEKLDYLYEKVRADKHSDPNLETDSRILHIEKVLSLFISKEDKLENVDDELLKTLPDTRPELQKLILSKYHGIDFNDEVLEEKPVMYTNLNECSFDDDSIEDLPSMPKVKQEVVVYRLPASAHSSIVPDERLEFFRVLNDPEQRTSQKTSETLTLNKFSFCVDVLNKATMVDESGMDVEDISLVRSVIQEKAKNSLEPKTIYNLPLIDYSKTNESSESLNEELVFSKAESKIEKVCYESLNEVIEQTIYNTAIIDQLNESFETSSELKTARKEEKHDPIYKQETQPLNKANFYFKHQKLNAPRTSSFKYNEENCSDFNTERTTMDSAQLTFNLALAESHPIEWEEAKLNKTEISNPKELTISFVERPLFKSIIQNEILAGEDSEILVNNDYINNVHNLEPVSVSFTDLTKLNLGSPNATDNEDDDVTISDSLVNKSLNSSNEDLVSFIEQIEKYEVISNDQVLIDSIEHSSGTTQYNCANRVHRLIEEERAMHLSADSIDNSKFVIEKEKLHRLVEQIEIPKWEKTSRMVVDKIVLNESVEEETRYDEKNVKYCGLVNESMISDAESSISEVSSTSSKIHLIESVEIVTHHNNALEYEPNDTGIKIHKVDINRLQIREKPKDQSRFKVDFKQEELTDLRDFTTKKDSNHFGNLSTDKIFAKKFADQIVKLSSAKLANIDQNHQRSRHTSKYQKDIDKYDNINFDKISTKSSAEILQSLNNMKDVGKHLTDSIVDNNENGDHEAMDKRKSKPYIYYENHYAPSSLNIERTREGLSDRRASGYVVEVDDEDSLREVCDVTFDTSIKFEVEEDELNAGYNIPINFESQVTHHISYDDSRRSQPFNLKKYKTEVRFMYN